MKIKNPTFKQVMELERVCREFKGERVNVDRDYGNEYGNNFSCYIWEFENGRRGIVESFYDDEITKVIKFIKEYNDRKATD